MVKFLYISFFFPPLAGAESRYNLSLIRRLYAKDFLPTIVTAPKDYSYPKDSYLEKLIPEGVEIKRINWFCQSDKYINKARELIKIPQNPLIFRGWKYLYNAAREEIISKKYQFIYSVHGIGAAHLAALKLKKETDFPWIAEFRDPWIHNFIERKYMKDKSWKWWYLYNLKKTKKFSKKILKNADLMIVESAMHGELLVKDFGIRKDKVLPYGMGYEEDYFSEDKSCPIKFVKKPVIGFVGSIYYGYEDTVRNFVVALKELERKGFEFTLVSVGGSSSIFSKYARRKNLKNFLPIDTVNLASALGLMRLMDFGVILGPKEYKLIVNSKLWEYLRLNLSIVAVVPENCAAARIIKEGKCGHILPYNVEGMVSILEDILDSYRKRKVLRANPEFIAQFSRERMVDKLVEKIEKLICKK